ncbi:MAG: dihydroorotase [Candidatus Dormiibacterota bacterium]
MNAILRGVRVIDPLGRLDAAGQDVWIDGGKILAIYHHIDAAGVPIVDLTPPAGTDPCVLCPGFIDLHAHLRQPGDDEAETLESGSRAAAAGGFTSVVAMANTSPPIDTPERVAEARLAASNLPVSILQVAALTRDLAGAELVDIRKCIEAGAVAVGDDGRNAVSPRQLAIALAEAAHLSRGVFVHPEDEEMIAQANATQGSVTRSTIRPAETETRAVNLAIRALAHARSGHLHLQHLSAEGSVASLRRARHQGLAVSAEVTPHHLSMWLPIAEEPDPQGLRKVNPPLRAEHDRNALVRALREGLIEAVATDHAPHRADEKSLAYADAAPGMIGLETALAACITIGGMGGEWLATLVERLTAGPHRILGPASGVPEPRLRIGESATCTLFDPNSEWTVGEAPLESRSRNTPLIGARLRGTVLLTMAGGRVVHRNAARVPLAPERVSNA